MTFPISTPILYALAIFLLARTIYSQLLKHRRNRAFAAFAAANGCEDPPAQPNILPYGIERLIRFVTFKGDILDDFIVPQYETYGWTNAFYGLVGPVLNTAEPANIQTILSLRFEDFSLGSKRRENFAPLLGPEGIFTSDGEEWEHSRMLIRPQFSREQISDLDATEKHVQNLFQAIPEQEDGGWTKEVNLMDLFYRFTLDTATEFLFGQSTDSQLTAIKEKETSPTASTTSSHFSSSLRPQIPESSSTSFPTGGAPPEKDLGFAEAFTYAQDFLSWQLRFPSFLWPLLTLPGSATRRKTRNAIAISHRFVDHYVDLALRTPPESSQDDEKKQRPLTPDNNHQTRHASGKKRYVLLNELALSTQNPTELRSHVLHTLLAGRDTTASLLSWSFLLLPRYPDIFTKLRREVLAAFPPATDEEDYPGDITFSKLKGCRYLQHFLNEVLRLYPVVPLNFRVAVRDTVLPTGGGPEGDKPVAVREGQIVPYPVYVMHRRKDLWGEDAEEFRPERWEGRKVGWEFLPFNGGPRICLGQQFALAGASYMVVRMLQRYSYIEAVRPMEEISKGLSLTLFPGKGVHVRLFRGEGGPGGRRE